MSLQVWMPLNGDLRNQGLSNLIFTNVNSNYTTIDNSGKIGKCYTNSSHTAGGLVSNATINLGQKQSMFCWFKFTNLLSSSSLGGNLVSQHRYSSNQGLGISIKYVSATTGYLSVNTGNGSSRTYNTYCGTTLLQANTWYHGGFTYDNGIIKIYINGNCENTVNIGQQSVPADYLVVFAWSLNSTSGSEVHGNYKLQGSLNDVRVYDHCLSEQEVKKLAQGLVLHYPLNRGGMGQENLWRNSSCQNNLDNMGQSTNKFTLTTKDGYKCAHLSGQLDTTGYLHIPDAILPTAGDWYTISADMRIDNYSAGSTNPYVGIYFGGDHLNTDNTGGWYGGSSYSGDGKAEAGTFVNTYNNKGWHRVTCTVQYLHGGSEYKKGAFYLGYIYARDFTGDLYVKNIKLEKGKIATSWCDGPSVINTDLKTATTVSGVTYTPGGFSNISVSGTSTGTGACYLQAKQAREAGIYSVHCYGGLSSDGVRFIPYKTSGDTTTYYDMTASGSKSIYVAPGDTYGYYLRTNGNNVAVNTTIWAFHNFEPLEEYDISGFCNNGTRVGTFEWSSDTPKYSVSQVFTSGNNYIDCGASQEVLPTDGLTVSLWINYSTWGNPVSCTEGGGWNFENSSGIQFPVYVADVGYKVANSGVATSALQNGWHMLTGTFDKTNVKIYIDGVLKATTATGSTNGIGYAANHCFVGAEAAGSTSIAAATLVGKLSDFRIYATALSAADVKSLYQNCATIGPDGTIYGQIRN